MKKMNIDQVAKLAYVSRSVVSRVLNDHPNVSDEARERVMRVIEKYNYRPNSAARSLATDRTFEICILAPRRNEEALTSWIWPMLHVGISEQCIDWGYFVSSSMISSDISEEIIHRILHGHKFDGYILVTQDVTRMVAPILQSRDVPVVLIGHDPAYASCSSVDVDNFDGAYQATMHLIDLGHRQVAAVLGHSDRQETVDRRGGYLQALQDAGFSEDDALIAEGSYSQKSGYDITKRWLATTLPPAIFYASDSMAVGGLLAFYEADVAVPDDVAIVGFDDLPGSRYTTPPLTTVHQPVYEKGEQAASMLIDQIEGRVEEIVHLQLHPELVVRDSCGAAKRVE